MHTRSSTQRLRPTSALPGLCVLGLCVLGSALSAQVAEGADAGRTLTQDLELFAEARAGLEAGVRDGTFNGVVALVDVDGELIFEAAIGERDASGAPMTADTIFQIYSMTKPVTAVAALVLCEEGAFDLDDPVAELLPALGGREVFVAGAGGAADTREPALREMTVRDLLRHTAGLTYGIFDTSPVDRMLLAAGVFDEANTSADLVEILAGVPLKSQPGTRFEYSLASDVLGRLVEVASGVSLDAFLEDRVFGPLGMRDTGFHVGEADLDRTADVYRRGLGGLKEVPRETRSALGSAPPMASGGGGLFSTARDYLRFCRMLAEGGALDGTRILRAETVDAMLSDQLAGISASSSALQGGGFGFGLGVMTRDTGRGPRAGTAWWGGLAGTGFWIDREERMVGIFMIQNMGELGHADRFRADVYRDIGR